MTPNNLLTEWSRLLIGSLARAGVTEAVISPGSRSTPFTWAALNEPKLTTRVVIDERSAAFYAVGHAKITGAPVLLICTSGSAAANYFPAIVEADRSGTPLVVLTSDRPFELQAADAPQTIDQVKLYGDAVREYFELGLPDAAPLALRSARRVAAHAAALARGPVPGPVHLNARARQPLEPVTASDGAGRELAASVDALLAEQPVLSGTRATASDEALDAIAKASRIARRGLIVCGPLSPAAAAPNAVAMLARSTGFPVAAESTSQLRFRALDGVRRVHALDGLLRGRARERFTPDCVIRIGAAPTSTAWSELLAALPTLREHVVSAVAWSDPHGTAATMAIGDVADALTRLVARLAGSAPAGDAAWIDTLTAADDAGIAALDTLRPNDEGAFVRALVGAIPDGSLLALGNSMPVREVDTFAPGDERDIVVWSQRGANGIDGLIAGATGAAEAAARPTALLLGDVSALHDVGSFSVARECTQPLAIVVIDNGGGRIFERLPIASTGIAAREEWQAWLTPPRLDFEALAQAFGIIYERADDTQAAREGLSRALETPGATLLHVVVDGERTIPAHRDYWAEVDRRVAELP